MACVLLCHALEGLHARYPIEAPRQFLDDLAQFVVGKPAALVDGMSNAAVQLIQGIHSRGCKISSKSNLVGTGKDAVQRTCSLVQAQTGIVLEPVLDAKDLGITFGGQRRRVSASTAHSVRAEK